MSSQAMMVVMIVLIVTFGKILSSRYAARDRTHDARVESADAMRHSQEVRDLKERIAVLERVVTDNHGSIDLDREIERLRDR